MRVNLFFLFLLLSSFSFSQFLCYTAEDTSPQPHFFSGECGIQANYTPIISSQTPIVTVRIAFHVFQKSDGTGNFQNNPTDIAFLHNIINNANMRYANLDVLNMGTSPYIQDSRIRLVLEKIYFHPNTTDWTVPGYNGISTFTKYVVNDYDNYGLTDDDKYNVQHILISGNPTGGGGSSWSSIGNPGIGTQGYILEVGWYNHYLTHGVAHYHWGPVSNLIHELGHAFGMFHNFHTTTPNNDQCDECTDNDPVGLSCPIRASSNNYMDYFPGGYNSSNPEPGFSQCQLSQAHYYLSGGAGTISQTVLKDYCISTPSKTIEINGIYTWNSHKKLRGDLIINPGSSLTVKCKLHMPENAKLIIKPGAKVIIDGGEITNECGNLWQGIEVWGTSNQHQYPEAQPTYQGKLEIKNGGTISNAYLAAQNWKPDDYGKIGGVIISEGGVFKNNNRSVAFMTYENFNPSNSAIKRDNLSRFTNTEFVVNDDFIPTTFGTHITMWQVYGINFYNCQFSNQITSKSYSAAHNKGIYSIDAGYRIYASCSTTPPFGTPCPSGNLLKSTFTGFNKAIEATGAGTTKTIAIDQAVFQNNLVGVDFNELDNFSVNRSTFMLGNPYGTSYFTFLLGITAANSSGFAMEENQFSRLAGYYGATYGIRVTDSGTENNRLYKNAFSSLYYGQYLIGINRNASNALKGLQFLCNSFDGNTRAVHVGNSVSTHGVRSYQGEYSPLKSAGNTFTNVPSGGYSIYNASTWPISYYHSNGTTLPTSNTANVTTYYTSNANTCASSFSGGIMLASILQHKSDSLSEIYDALEYNYLSLIDQGNTADFIQKINAEWSEDAWVLRNKLVTQAPYVSQEALLEAMEKRVLPNAMVLEVCLANPDITKGEGFIEKLNNATESSLPEYMQNYIRQNWDEKTIRTTLEAQMASVAHEQSVVEHELVSQVLVNEERSYDTILAVFSNKKGTQGKIDLLEFAIEQEKWEMADSVLTAVLTDPLLKDEQHHFNYYNEYIRFRMNLNGRKLSQLNHSEITELESLSQLEGRVAGYARNILCFFYDICYESEASSSEKSIMAINQPIAEKTLNELFYSVELYPNPSEDYSSMKWEILDLLDNCNYKIYDIKGIEMSRGTIATNKGETIIDTRTLPNGLYILTIENAGERKQSLKLAVTHNK